MSTAPRKTILCISSYEKGYAFLRQAHALGWRVLMITGESCRNADWPYEVLSDIFFVPDPDKQWNVPDLIHAVSFLARSTKIDRIVALDDFDVEKAAALREHLRTAGMGDTTARNFRDKLAMRGRAKDAGIPIPGFTGVFNDEDVNQFIAEVPGPWVLKPRLQANAIGIKKLNNGQELWEALDELGDERSFFLLEQFIPGRIAHVDSVIVNQKVKFACASVYGTPPMEVFHGGRVFTTRTLEPGESLEKKLTEANQRVVADLGLKYGVSHTEFIIDENENVFFLETSARVGGAHIAELVEFTTGINLWAEWAKLECSDDITKYKPPTRKKNYGALMVTLAQQEWPDMSKYDDKEVMWKINKRQHAGLIIASPKKERITELLDSYLPRFYSDFFASLPAAEKASQMS